MSHDVLLFGATRGTGLAVAERLARRGEPPAACVRPAADRAPLESLGVHLVTADALDAEAVERVFADGNYRAVVSTIGGGRNEPARPDFETTRNIVDAARRHGVRRMLLVTAIGAGDSRPVLSDHAWKFLGPVIELKTRAEAYLMESGLDATILRPGGMRSDPPTGKAICTTDHTVMGMIHRADLAALVIECLDDDATIGAIFHTVDPTISEQPPLQRGDTPDSAGRR